MAPHAFEIRLRQCRALPTRLAVLYRLLGHWKAVLLGVMGLLAGGRPAASFQGACSTDWISKTPGGQPAWGTSNTPALSEDGRFVAFVSLAPNLVPGDTNFLPDVFVVDRQLNAVERVSVGSGGEEGNGRSLMGDISWDGRYVVFVSESTNWDPRDTHPGWDVYLRDRQTQTTELITVHVSPPVAPSGGSGDPRISPDGRFVAFHHSEDNLVPGDSNGWVDVFVHDRTTGVTELISVDSNGVQSDKQCGMPAMSADGRWVAFVSDGTNWYPGNLPWSFSKPHVYLRDRATSTLIPITLNDNGSLASGSAGWDIDLSDDGRYLVYLYRWKDKDLPLMWDSLVFVRDLVTGDTQPVAYSVFGNNGSVGTYFVHPMVNMSISADGRFVTFDSWYDEHVLHSGNRNGQNVFIHDRLTGLTQAASLGPSGQWPSLPPQTGAEAFQGFVSPDGTAVAFICEDPSFGSGNALYNVYVRACNWSQPQVYCDPQVNSLGCRPVVSFSGLPSASAGSGFAVQAQKLLGKTTGMFLYSTQRTILTPFQGGYLCMEWPIRRMPWQTTGGGIPSSCTGSLSVDFNTWIAGGADPSLALGENVCIQAWSRDAGAPWGSSLSNALAFVIGP